MARWRRRKKTKSTPRKVEELVTHEDRTEADKVSSSELKEAMERAWDSPRINNSRYKARWKP